MSGDLTLSALLELEEVARNARRPAPYGGGYIVEIGEANRLIAAFPTVAAALREAWAEVDAMAHDVATLQQHIEQELRE